MLIRTADLFDLAQAFPASVLGEEDRHGAVFLVVRDSMLEAHRGPVHARVPLCVWARDRVIGWATWKALPDPRHAPETLDVERALFSRAAPAAPVQTRAIFTQRGDRRGYVDAFLVAQDDKAQSLDVPPLGMRLRCEQLDLAWAERGGATGANPPPFGVTRFNLVLRTQVAPREQGKVTRSVARLLGDGLRRGTATIPAAWLADAIHVLPHRDGLALLGRCWWADLGSPSQLLSGS